MLGNTYCRSFFLIYFPNIPGLLSSRRFFFFPYCYYFVSHSIVHNINVLFFCVCDFVQSIGHGNRSGSRSGWRRCVAVVAASSLLGSRVRRSTTVPARRPHPLRILKSGLCPEQNWRAQRRKKRALSSNVHLNNKHSASDFRSNNKCLLARIGRRKNDN